MTTLVNIDGRTCAGAEARISVFDRGFLYGDSVYEVVRSYGETPFAIKEHLARLRHSAEQIGIEIPLPATEIDARVRQLIREAGNPDSYVRIIVTRGEGEISLDPAMAVDPHCVIIVKEHQAPPRHLYTEGASVVMVKSGRLTDGALPAGTKSGNYLVNLMALAHAKKRGSYEAVLVDADGRVLEGTTCNVFIVKNGTVRTPPLGAGILAGITRDAVISLCRRGGIPIEETDLTPADMKGADEAFLTSTLRDVMPITKVEEITVGNGMTGPLTETIRRAYQDYVRDELAKGPRACGRG